MKLAHFTCDSIKCYSPTSDFMCGIRQPMKPEVLILIAMRGKGVCVWVKAGVTHEATVLNNCYDYCNFNCQGNWVNVFYI